MRDVDRRIAGWAVTAFACCAVAALLPGAATAAGLERAYELVTPPRSVPEVRLGGGLSTADGNVVCFNAEEALAGAAPNGIVTGDDGYCAQRTATGWDTEWVTGPAPQGEIRGSRGAQVYYLSADGERVVFASDMGIFPDYPGGEPGTSRFGTLSGFMYEGGQTRWLAPSPAPLREVRSPLDPMVFAEREPLAASDDLRHGIFVSSLQLVPQDTNGDVVDVYEWTPDGIRLVSRDASGSAVGGSAPLGNDVEQLIGQPGTVSPDGSRIFFEHVGALAGSPPGVNSVFMREGDELTHVSPRRGPAAPADVVLVGAYADGSVVYLRTAEQLTGEAKQDGDALYRYDVEADELSLVATHADGIVFLGASPDGETALYRTGGLPELFIRRDGVATSLGALSFLDTVTLVDAFAGRTDKRALRFADDGSAIVFASFSGFDGAPMGSRQVFRWTPADGVKWVSKPADGSTPAGMAALGNYSSVIPDPRVQVLDTLRNRPSTGRAISEDGSRVFFETTDPLVAADVNGFIDVYEWHDGEVSLVSPGTQPEHAFYHDSSADGSTVFFTTRARLIPELDRSSSPDLYAARVGGGFPLPETPPACAGDPCQGPPPSTQPPPGRPSSEGLQGPGNVGQPRPPRIAFSAAELSAKQRRALASGARTQVRVTVSRAGRVRAALFARIGDRRVRVAGASRVAANRGTVRLPLRLSAAARSTLARRGALRLSLEVTHSKSKRTVRKVVVLHD